MNKISLYWWKGKGERNFGDILSPIVVGAISGREVQHVMGPRKMIAIGSLLQVAQPGDIIWGAGFIGTGIIPSNLKVYAVRGPKTREVILKKGGICPKVYGDPAIFLPYIFGHYANTPKAYKFGIIPHYVDFAKTKSYIKDPAVNVIDILSGVDNVIKEATKCEVLFSSSLHGIILGECFKIPTGWVTMGGALAGGEFKFEDYYLSTQREKQIKLDWSNGINISSTTELIKSIETPIFDHKALIDSFPHKEFSIDAKL